MIKRIIKILSICIITTVAILGLLFKFKDDAGVLTNWGLISLVSTGVSALIAIAIEVIEYIKEKENTIKEELNRKLLAEIRENTINTNYPILPFRLFYTIRHTTHDKEIEKYFSSIKGYKSIKKNDILKFIGTCKIGELYKSPEEESPEESSCTLKELKIIEKAKDCAENSEETIIKVLADFRIEIYFMNSNDTPDIILESNYGATSEKGKIKEVRLYDNILYQDGIITGWNIKTKSKRVYGVNELLNSKIRIITDIWNDEKLIDEHPPIFTNLHLYFGNDPTFLLFLKKEDLSSEYKAYRRNSAEEFLKLEGELANEFFKTLAVDFKIEISNEIFNNQLKQYS